MTDCIQRSKFQLDRLKPLQTEICRTLDIFVTTCKDYEVRIKKFIQFTDQNRLHYNTYLEYKRFLGSNETCSVATKNKYLISAKVFLDGLAKLQLIPVKITDNIKGFSQSKLHKKYGLSDDDISKIQNHCLILEPTPTNLRLKSILSLFIFQGLRQIEVSRLLPFARAIQVR